MNVLEPSKLLLSQEKGSYVVLDTNLGLLYLAHSCIWLCFSEAEFRDFTRLILSVEFSAQKLVFPLGINAVLIRSVLPGVSFCLQEADINMLKALLNSALTRLNDRVLVN